MLRSVLVGRATLDHTEMSAILLEITVILFLLVLNGVFSMSEMALVAARKIRLERKAEGGSAGARAALSLAANPTNFLSTVQIGITLVGVTAGAFGGAGIAERIAVRLALIPALERYADTLALGIVVAIITYLSLVIGELVPKQIALSNPERVATLIARPMRVVSRVGGPLVRLLTGSTNLVFRVLGIRATVDPKLTEHDIRATVEQGAEAGVLDKAEHDIIENTFRLGDRQVGSVMTPRTDMPWIDGDADRDEVLQRVALARGRPLVVCDGDVDRVFGIARAEQLLLRSLAGEPFDLRASLSTPLFVPVTMPALRLLEAFRRTGEQTAIALDEHGGVQGIATVDDIIEALVGPLPEAGETEPLEIMRQKDGSWLVDGATAIEDLDAALDLDPQPPDDRRNYHTVAGLIITKLGRLASPGESIELDGWRYEVVRTDGRRIITIRVRAVPEARDEAPNVDESETGDGERRTGHPCPVWCSARRPRDDRYCILTSRPPHPASSCPSRSASRSLRAATATTTAFAASAARACRAFGCCRRNAPITAPIVAPATVPMFGPASCTSASPPGASIPGHATMTSEIRTPAVKPISAPPPA